MLNEIRGFYTSTILVKSSIINIWRDPKYAFDSGPTLSEPVFPGTFFSVIVTWGNIIMSYVIIDVVILLGTFIYRCASILRRNHRSAHKIKNIIWIFRLRHLLIKACFTTHSFSHIIFITAASINSHVSLYPISLQFLCVRALCLF